jgi:glycosyltransferase involved in cell wall biosynthesis
LRLFSEIDGTTRDALYRCALALVFPSKCEGFGYPVLEAMSQGCPPLTFEKGPASEMVNGIIPLANEPTPPAFSEMLNRYAAMAEPERARIGTDLIARAKIFSPQAMAAGTLAVLRSAAFEK